jgi:predicted  nucleic acid-binding Zn-ribbon protein
MNAIKNIINMLYSSNKEDCNLAITILAEGNLANELLEDEREVFNFLKTFYRIFKKSETSHAQTADEIISAKDEIKSLKEDITPESYEEFSKILRTIYTKPSHNRFTSYLRHLSSYIVDINYNIVDDYYWDLAQAYDEAIDEHSETKDNLEDQLEKVTQELDDLRERINQASSFLGNYS